jgi:hypothetical protein
MTGYSILVMKNIFRISAFTLFLSISTCPLFGQVFVSQSNEWFADDCCYSVGQTNCYTYKYWFSDTVIINSLTYLHLNSNNPQPLFEVGAYYREDNGIVFMKKNINEAEIKIYNFNLSVGEEFEIGNPDNNFSIKVLSVDSIMLNSGEKRKRLNIASSLDTNITTFWIEGIGSGLSPMNTLYMFSLDCWNEFNCFHKDGFVEFQIGDCDLSASKDLKPSESSFILSPNPATNQVRFSRADAQPLNRILISVTDVNGRTVWQSPPNTNNADYIEWQTDNAPSGGYFYIIQDASGLIQTGRVTIMK